MINRGITTFLILILASALAFVACDVISEKGIEESLDIVPNVTAITGAQNTTIKVNRGTTSNFNIDIQNVEWNTLISNGERNAYCIAWKDPISSNNDIYEGVGVYSTAGDKQFASINRLFSMKNALQKADPEITWRELQIAIWTLLPFQEFDMNMRVNDLPSYMRSNGQPNFSKEKVQFIIDAVQSSSDDIIETTMCVIGTEEGTQTLIVECDETAFAYGGNYPATYDGVAGIPGEDGYANCFPEDDLSIQRWGWSNGLLNEGNYSFPLYAGAGQCILNKGQYSGDVEIDYSDGTVTVTFTATDGAVFGETHLFVGNEKLPKNNGSYTAAPGQYPNNDDVISSNSKEVIYQVTGVSGEIYVVAHAVMGFYGD